MASMQTRLARAATAGAEESWKRHAAVCSACIRAHRKERHAEPCNTGAELRSELARLRAEARKESELDKQVPEDQEALF